MKTETLIIDEELKKIENINEKDLSEKRRSIDEEIATYAGDILSSPNFESTKEYFQHGNMTVHEHCISVARTSLAIRDYLGVKCNSEDLVRGALLHDYFLYDWHKPDKVNSHRLHGFFHPARALKNAREEFDVTLRQADIIIKHMWPLTVVPPLCREGWIVTAADKYCSLMETMHIHKGRIHERRQKRRNAISMIFAHSTAGR